MRNLVNFWKHSWVSIDASLAGPSEIILVQCRLDLHYLLAWFVNSTWFRSQNIRHFSRRTSWRRSDEPPLGSRRTTGRGRGRRRCRDLPRNLLMSFSMRLGALKVKHKIISVQRLECAWSFDTFHSSLRLLNDGLNNSQRYRRIGLWSWLLLLLHPVALMAARRRLRYLLHVGIVKMIVNMELVFWWWGILKAITISLPNELHLNNKTRYWLVGHPLVER